jgi:hypothetical protein
VSSSAWTVAIVAGLDADAVSGTPMLEDRKPAAVRQRSPVDVDLGSDASITEGVMKIDKQQVTDYLREQGDPRQVQRAERQLPQKVDIEQQDDANLLQNLGVDPMALVKQIVGGKGIVRP